MMRQQSANLSARILLVLVTVLLAFGCSSQQKSGEQERQLEELRQAMQTQSAALSAKIVQANHENEDLRAALAERDAEVRRLQDQVRTLSNRLDAALKRVEQLNRQRDLESEVPASSGSR
jgi:septal ring factor EnvC (AmiA/AmiB activator)